MNVDPAVAARKRAFLQKNPSYFLERVFGWRPYPQQEKVATSLVENVETLVESAHGTGKTAITARLAIWFLECFVPSKVITTAPTMGQVRNLLWAEIGNAWNNKKVELPGELTGTRLQIADDHFAVGLSPKIEVGEDDQGVRMQGYHSPHILVAFDEGPGVNEQLWEVKDSLMTSAHVRFLAIGNPVFASGPFYTAWSGKGGPSKIVMGVFDSPNFLACGVKTIEQLRKIRDRALKEGPKFLDALPTPMPALVTVKWAVRMLIKWGEDSALFKSRVLSLFPTAGEDNLIPLGWLQACQDLELKPRDPANRCKALGVDVARYGSASTVLIGLDEGTMVFHKSYQGYDTTWTANQVIEKIRDEHYTVVAIDTTGLGAGVTDQVMAWINDHQHPCAIIAFEGGRESSDPERYVNLRSETYWQLREAVQERRISLEDRGEMYHQLSSLRYRYTRESRVEIESKDQMKRRGLDSPDEADALCMAVHAYAIGGPQAISGAGDRWMDQFDDPGTLRTGSEAPWR